MPSRKFDFEMLMFYVYLWFDFFYFIVGWLQKTAGAGSVWD